MRLSRLILFICCACAASIAQAADWPGWRGPDRSGASKETGLLQKWPKEGPELAWSFEDAGTGFGSFAVVGGRVYVLGARPIDAAGAKRMEQIVALDDKGKERWKADIGPMYDFKTNQWSGGPNSTPFVDGDLIFALGSQGILVCVKAADGAEVWRKDLAKELGAEVSPGPGGPPGRGWGFSWSPLVDGDQVVCTPGGAKGLFAALDKTSGKVLWRSTGIADACTYSSPIVAEVNGVRQYVALTQTGAVGVSAKDGSTLWEYQRDDPFPDVVCPTPVCKGDLVYLNAWGGGGTLLRLIPDGGKFKTKVVYANKEIAAPHGGVVLANGFLFGNHDFRAWECLDFEKGDVKWASKPGDLSSGSLIYADGCLYCLAADSDEAALLEASPNGYKELGRFTLPKQSAHRKKSGKLWAHPVVSDGRLYLRDQELVFCYKVKAP
jgi:outer membrane protein assembly factor BamB